MKYLTFILITVLSLNYGHSQIHELGLVLGGSNFIGDVGSTNYVSPNNLAFGGVYKWNRSPRHSYRFSALFTDLEGIDNKSDDPSRIERNYEFNSSILELSFGIEYTFLDFDIHNGGKVSTPYIATGIVLTNYDDFFFGSSRQQFTDTSSWDIGIPIALGYKTTLSPKIILGIEIGARYMFSDSLDGSIPDFEENRDLYSFGNINNNDWYMFTGITLTYTFGRNPCFCSN